MATKTSAATEHIFKSGFPTTVTSRNSYDEGWIVISMKDDWKRIFAFEE
jgi:hypothetical protein